MQAPDNKPGNYYVSVRRDNGDSRFLLGPYVNDHAGALAMVEEARKMAQDMDPRAAWYAFGTARQDIEPGKPVELGILNKYFNEALNAVFVVTPQEKFKRAYRDALEANRAAFPSSYRWPVGMTVERFVEKMMAGLADKSAAWDSSVVAKACKAVGIKQRQGVIAAFLQEQVAPAKVPAVAA